jgi:hypothetical protein
MLWQPPFIPLAGILLGYLLGPWIQKRWDTILSRFKFRN